MKLLLIIVVVGAGLWYLMVKAHENAAVKAVTDSPLQMTKALQNDEARAQAAVEKANKTIRETSHDVEKAEAAQ